MVLLWVAGTIALPSSSEAGNPKPNLTVVQRQKRTPTQWKRAFRARFAVLNKLSLRAPVERAMATRQLRQFFTRSGDHHYTDGKGRLRFATTLGKTNFEGYVEASSNNVVELELTRYPINHLYVRIGATTYSRGSMELKKSNWIRVHNEKLENKPEHEKVSVLVSLSSSEMVRLQEFVSLAYRGIANGPFAYRPQDNVIGEYHSGRSREVHAPGTSNCTSWITHAQIGDRGETLGELVGVHPDLWGMPRNFVRALVAGDSKRVIAIGAHNPVGGFSRNYPLDDRIGHD